MFRERRFWTSRRHCSWDAIVSPLLLKSQMLNAAFHDVTRAAKHPFFWQIHHIISACSLPFCNQQCCLGRQLAALLLFIMTYETTSTHPISCSKTKSNHLLPKKKGPVLNPASFSIRLLHPKVPFKPSSHLRAASNLPSHENSRKPTGVVFPLTRSSEQPEASSRTEPPIFIPPSPAPPPHLHQQLPNSHGPIYMYIRLIYMALYIYKSRLTLHLLSRLQLHAKNNQIHKLAWPLILHVTQTKPKNLQ